MLETQLKRIRETLEGAVGENVTVNLWGYFFPEFEEGRTKEKALEIAATLIREFGFDAPSEVNHDGTRWLEVGNDPIRLVIYYTASLEERIAEAKETLVKLEA